MKSDDFTQIFLNRIDIEIVSQFFFFELNWILLTFLQKKKMKDLVRKLMHLIRLKLQKQEWYLEQNCLAYFLKIGYKEW